MILEMKGLTVDLNDEVDCHFMHEYLLRHRYKCIQDSAKTIDEKKALRDLVPVMRQRFNEGMESFRNKNQLYPNRKVDWEDEDRNILYIRKGYDTLQVHFVSYASHEGRLRLTHVFLQDYIEQTECDLLIVNEDALRLPEIVYPSSFLLGNGHVNDTAEKLAEKIKQFTRIYETSFLYCDSRHAGSGIAIGDLAGIKNAFVVHGQCVYDWDKSPWVQTYLRYQKMKEQGAVDPNYNDVILITILKTWQWEKHALDYKLLDPYRYTDMNVSYHYGIYDKEYEPMLRYLENTLNSRDNHNVKLIPVDYQFSKTNTHYIRSYTDKKLLPEYIKNLTD